MNAVAKNAVVALSLGFASAIIFGIGMIGPLTPSEGHPTLFAWLVFSVVPFLLTLVGTVVAKPWPVRIALLAGSIAILLWTVELLHVYQILRNHEIHRPSEDVREWFRCDNCGTPLQISSALSKTLYWTSIFGVLLIGIIFSFGSAKYFPGHEFPSYLLGGGILVVYGVLARLFWKTKLSRPRLHDPYSSLNLSDPRKKLRGRS